jgi:hypothetical protein
MKSLLKPIKTSNLLLIIGAVILLVLLIIANIVLKNHLAG